MFCLPAKGHINHLRDETAAADTGDPKVIYLAEGGTDWILLAALPAAGSPLAAKANATWPDEPIDLRYLYEVLWISRRLQR